MWGRLRAACLAVAALAAPLAGCGPKLDDLAPGEKGQVATVQDGDTLTLASGLRVHLAGVEAPHRGWPLADEARAALEKAALGRAAELRYGGARRLRNGAALAQVFVKSEGGRTIWLQEHLVRAGLARVHTRKDNAARAPRLLALEAEARAAKRGIWADPFYAVRPASAVGELDRFVIVEGMVVVVASQAGRTYLNFGLDPRSDFTVAIADEDLPAFTGANAPGALGNMIVRVRGFVRDRGGPLMRVDHPAQIEILGKANGGWTLFPPSTSSASSPPPAPVLRGIGDAEGDAAGEAAGDAPPAPIDDTAEPAGR
ncbi:MAG: thermonuclease family protein [Alphaproteobacteria bacterium]|nr:thermonuclease family protein [Alphaproteobacteria bacterium]